MERTQAEAERTEETPTQTSTTIRWWRCQVEMQGAITNASMERTIKAGAERGEETEDNMTGGCKMNKRTHNQQ